MRTKTVLKASALLAVAVVLGLLTVQGTYALWNKVVPVNAGTIQAADFRFTLTDVATGRAVDMTDTAGNSAVLALRPSGALTSQAPVDAGVSVTNATNAGSDFAARARIGADSISISPADMARFLKVKVAAPDGSSGCASAAYPDVDGMAEAIIGKGNSAIFCFRFSLSPDAPASLSGTALKIRVPITVDQL